MSGQIIGMHDWLASPPGQYLLAWERAQMAQAVGNVFGFHALQLGLPELNALEANRMPHRWLATQTPTETSILPQEPSASPRVALVTDFSALPFSANSLDLVVMPHALELSVDPHGVLREVARVLVPEGRVVICGLNPLSMWGFCQRRPNWFRWMGAQRLLLPSSGECIGYLRLRDWLSLLNLEIEDGRFGCYRPACSSQAWLQRFNWMDKAGERWWPILGSVYCLVAVKRVRGMTLINPARKAVRRLAVAPVTIANSSGNMRATGQNDTQT
ncbi:class I SAM-dependent methyltransferase [Rhodoferax sp. BLA1]|uniref:class I SAM-dependent methyltransferase n=1 Tax=Rhodoferax sp. BLA1 TaxID=2576062 RepID=UPI002106C2A0|nr:methyltransferase domain-containing protein [Rhodoferax sp. BLA1]